MNMKTELHYVNDDLDSEVLWGNYAIHELRLKDVHIPVHPYRSEAAGGTLIIELPNNLVIPVQGGPGGFVHDYSLVLFVNPWFGLSLSCHTEKVFSLSNDYSEVSIAFNANHLELQSLMDKWHWAKIKRETPPADMYLKPFVDKMFREAWFRELPNGEPCAADCPEVGRCEVCGRTDREKRVNWGFIELG